MIPYFLFLAFFLCSTIYDKRKLAKILLFFYMVFLVIFIGFREGGTGPADYKNYLSMYNEIQTTGDILNANVGPEIGFKVISYIGNFLHFDGQFVIFFMALLSVIPVVYVISKCSVYPMLSLVFWMQYILTMNMQSSRTSVAAAFCLLFFYFYSKRSKLSIISFVIALSFHASAIVTLLIILTKLSLRRILLIFSLPALFFFIYSPFQAIAFFFNFIGLSDIARRIVKYDTSSVFGVAMKVYDPRVVLSFVFMLLACFLYRKVNDKESIFWLKVAVVGFFVQFMFLDVTIISWRTSYYFLLGGVIYIPLIFSYLNIKAYRTFKVRRLASNMLLFAFAVYTAAFIFRSNAYHSYIY